MKHYFVVLHFGEENLVLLCRNVDNQIRATSFSSVENIKGLFDEIIERANKSIEGAFTMALTLSVINPIILEAEMETPEALSQYFRGGKPVIIPVHEILPIFDERVYGLAVTQEILQLKLADLVDVIEVEES